MSRMKIALISTTPPPVGGISRWTLRMLGMKLKNGWGIELVDDKPIDRESFGDNTKVNLFNEIKRAFRVWKDLNRTLRNDEIKLVHACPIASLASLMATYVYSIIAHHHKKKFIAHFRCTIPNMIHSKMQKVFLKLVCRNADYLMLLNSQTERYLKNLCSTPMEVVPNFVDLKKVTESRTISESVNSVIYVGGVTEEKGCIDIIDIAKSFPKIKFKMIGRTEQRVENYAKSSNNVEFLGVLEPDDVQRELNKADIFMFLSKYPGEGFSNALVEAMGAGLPCLVTDWAANADMIENKGGFVIPINSPNEGVQKLKEMLPKSTREQMSKWNYQKAVNEYSAEVITAKYVDVYEKVICCKKSRIE